MQEVYFELVIIPDMATRGASEGLFDVIIRCYQIKEEI
jgi:hypothetical protein